MMKRDEVLDLAKQIVCVDRDAQYGSPEDSFATIGLMWEAYLKGKYGVSIVLLPQDVAFMMILLKVARGATGKPKDDNWIDIAGYAACGGGL